MSDDVYRPAGPLDRACETEDELKALRALRRKIAATLDATSDARVIAQLSRHLSDILARMTELRGAGVGGTKPVEPKGVLSDLAKFRAARKSGTDD